MALRCALTWKARAFWPADFDGFLQTHDVALFMHSGSKIDFSSRTLPTNRKSKTGSQWT